MRLFNVRDHKICAFCQYWYDPANTALSPKAPGAGFWLVDETMKQKCMRMVSFRRPSTATCPDYACKLPT